jgi:hypothetical protein
VRALTVNKKDQIAQKWLDRWKRLDMFGQRVEFTFKGKRTYQTAIGAFISLFIRVVLSIFVAYEFYVVFSRKHPATSIKYRLTNQAGNPDSISSVNPFTFGLDIGFGFTSSNVAYINQTLLASSYSSNT